MAESSLFRKSSVDRIQSPEQLNDYLRVTNPAVWGMLAAVIILLAGLLLWAALTYIGSYADGTAQVENGVMTVRFEDPAQGKNVEAGMTVTVGDVSSTVFSVGQDSYGGYFALADTTLSDGSYDARVSYKQTQIIRLLFN